MASGTSLPRIDPPLEGLGHQAMSPRQPFASQAAETLTRLRRELGRRDRQASKPSARAFSRKRVRSRDWRKPRSASSGSRSASSGRKDGRDFIRAYQVFAVSALVPLRIT
jgi:hypothetical protein